LIVSSFLIGLLAGGTGGQAQETWPFNFTAVAWVWHPDGPEVAEVFGRQTWTLPGPARAGYVLVTADDAYRLFVNGQEVGGDDNWEIPELYEITPYLVAGPNVLAFHARNQEGPAGIMIRARLLAEDGTLLELSTDRTWKVQREPAAGWNQVEFNDAEWPAAKELGVYPCEPWGRLTKMSVDELAAWLREHRLEMVDDSAAHPPYSHFRGEYLRPEYADLYRQFLTVSHYTGLLQDDQGPRRMVFAAYSQPGPTPADPPERRITRFDFDLLEKDLAAMKDAGVHVYVRTLNWSELLNADGTWQATTDQPRGTNLPQFRYNYEIYDYFLDRVQAHGLHAAVEVSCADGLHPEVIPARWWGRVLLYDELWNAVLAAYTKILRYFSQREVIVEWVVGSPSVRLDHSLDDQRMKARFQAFLQDRYGTLENLKAAWRHGYDYAVEDPARWQLVPLPAGGQAYYPTYPWRAGVFDRYESWADVELPHWEYLRATEPPYQPIREGLGTAQENIPHDPVWIDFLALKEALVLDRMNAWAEAIRGVDPHHLLHYTNPPEFSPPWQGPPVFDRARLKFDLIGAGQGDPADHPSFPPCEGGIEGGLPCWAAVREMLHNTASYGGYLRANEAFPQGFAGGHGLGNIPHGNVKHTSTQWLADLVGGGAALALSGEWSQLSGRATANPPNYDRALLGQFGQFTQALERAPFSQPRAQVLIVRPKATALSLSAGPDFANTAALGEILARLNVPFEIVTDADLTLGQEEPFKVDLDHYNFVFIPTLQQMPSAELWPLFREWLEREKYRGRRGLCLGRIEWQDAHFNPLDPATYGEAFRSLTGVAGYESYVDARGPQTFSYALGLADVEAGTEVELPFHKSYGRLGRFPAELGEGVEPVWSIPTAGTPAVYLYPHGIPVLVRRQINLNYVYTAGFNLGLADHPVWGGGVTGEAAEPLVQLYRAMLDTALLDRPVAPPNVSFYVAPGNAALLFKERSGQRCETLLETAQLGDAVFADAVNVKRGDGLTRIERRLGPYEMAYLPCVAHATVEEGGEVCLRVGKVTGTERRPSAGAERRLQGRNGVRPLLRFGLQGRGTVELTLTLEPDTAYQALIGPERQAFRTDAEGHYTLSLTAPERSLSVVIVEKEGPGVSLF